MAVLTREERGRHWFGKKGRRRQATGCCFIRFWYDLNQELDFLKFKSDLLMMVHVVGGVIWRGRMARRWVHVSTQECHSDGNEKERDWWEEGGD